MNLFPFPDRIQSREELKRDVLFEKIPETDRIPVCDMAWDWGVKTAKEIMEQYPGKNIREIIKGEGLRIENIPKDEEQGRLRIFGEYYSAKKKIVLYTGSIILWARSNGLARKTAEDLVLAHEFFHSLECTKLGETSKLYKVPVIRIGGLVVSRSGVRALSEIAAHGFSRTYFESLGIVSMPE